MTKNTNPTVIDQKAAVRDSALDFAKTLVMLETPKRTALISIMKQYGLKVREARSIYAVYKKPVRWK